MDEKKIKWEGKFNWHGEVKTYYRHATSEAQAKVRLLNAMARELGVATHSLYPVYDGSVDNFSIKEVTG